METTIVQTDLRDVYENTNYQSDYFESEWFWWDFDCDGMDEVIHEDFYGTRLSCPYCKNFTQYADVINQESCNISYECLNCCAWFTVCTKCYDKSGNIKLMQLLEHHNGFDIIQKGPNYKILDHLDNEVDENLEKLENDNYNILDHLDNEVNKNLENDNYNILDHLDNEVDENLEKWEKDNYKNYSRNTTKYGYVSYIKYTQPTYMFDESIFKCLNGPNGGEYSLWYCQTCKITQEFVDT